MSRDPGLPIVAVGHDGTDASRPALEWAEEVAAATPGARLDLVHAASLPPIPVQIGGFTVDELLDRHESEVRALLEGEQHRLAARGVESRVVMRRWLAAETLIEHARDEGAGLLVVGQHGGRAGRLLLGSVSAEVARDAEAPVVVVRGESPSPPRRVLLATDGSTPSLRAAAAVARWFPRAEVLALHLRDRDASLDLGELTQSLGAAGIAAERLELRVSDEPAAAALLAVAGDEAIDLVAAGRRGRSGWRERILGGVSEKLLHLAPCPVLVAH
jgi:nucleotide-binding universal stress UspA family protein